MPAAGSSSFKISLIICGDDGGSRAAEAWEKQRPATRSDIKSALRVID